MAMMPRYIRGLTGMVPEDEELRLRPVSVTYQGPEIPRRPTPPGVVMEAPVMAMPQPTFTEDPQSRAALQLNADFDALMRSPQMQPAPKPRRDNALLRGIGAFLGYIPKGGTRGDRVELIADFARGLLGEAPISQVEADYNQRMAGEMLRRAIATGDVNEIARLSPEMAQTLQQFADYPEDREYILKQREQQMLAAATKQQLDEQALRGEEEENRIIAANRVVQAARQAAGRDPAQFQSIIGGLAAEQPNLFKSYELDLAGLPNGADAMNKYFSAVRAGGAGSARSWVRGNIQGIGPVYLNQETGEPVTDDNGNYVRPFVPKQYKDLGGGYIEIFDPVSQTREVRPATGVDLSQAEQVADFYQDGGMGMPGMGAPSMASAPPPTVLPQGAEAPMPMEAGAPMPMEEMAPQVAPPVQRGPGFLGTGGPVAQRPQTPAMSRAQQIAQGEALIAGEKAAAQERAVRAIELEDDIYSLAAGATPIFDRIETLDSFDDEKLGLIAGLPSVKKAKEGGFGFVRPPPGDTEAMEVWQEFQGLVSSLRNLGFQNVKGAGQVTEAESKFAADAIAALESGKERSAEGLRREINHLRRFLTMSILTRNARLWALRNPGQFDVTKALATSDDIILELRRAYIDANPTEASAILKGAPPPSDKPAEAKVRPRVFDQNSGRFINQ